MARRYYSVNGGVIRDLRRARGMTQDDLASRLGITKQMISMIERGSRKMVESNLITLCETFGVPQALVLSENTSDDNGNIMDQLFASLDDAELQPQREGSIIISTIFGATEQDVYSLPDSFEIVVKDDAMAGARILEGDIVCIEKKSNVKNGEIALVALDKYTILRRYYRYGDIVVLRTDSDGHEESVYMPEAQTQISVIGRAVSFKSTIK